MHHQQGRQAAVSRRIRTNQSLGSIGIAQKDDVGYESKEPKSHVVQKKRKEGLSSEGFVGMEGKSHLTSQAGVGIWTSLPGGQALRRGLRRWLRRSRLSRHHRHRWSDGLHDRPIERDGAGRCQQFFKFLPIQRNMLAEGDQVAAGDGMNDDFFAIHISAVAGVQVFENDRIPFDAELRMVRRDPGMIDDQGIIG